VSLQCHSIGDNALLDVLDAFEQIKKDREARGEWENCDLRHQVAHLQVVRPADVPRFKELNVIANFQPYWSFKDSWMLVAMQHLQERSAWQYPIREVVETGAHVCFGRYHTSDDLRADYHPVGCTRVCVCACACVRVRVCVCVCACACACVCGLP
jgi:predicted amidohydrolase YtcJ